MNEYLPLTFARHERETLFKLCEEYRSKWDVEYYIKLHFLRKNKPRVQTDYIIFQWVNWQPKYIRVQMLRCTEEYALIEARNDFSGFVLKKYEKPTDFHQVDSLFNIDTKFYYQPEIPRVTEGVEPSSHGTEPQRRNQSTENQSQNTTVHRRTSCENP